MEDTLRVREYICKVTGECVLILVLMEDTLRAKRIIVKRSTKSLNPCFNGRYSQRRVLY